MSSHVGWIDQSPSLPIVRLLLIFRRTLWSCTSARRQSDRLTRRINIRPTKGKKLNFLFCFSLFETLDFDDSESCLVLFRFDDSLTDIPSTPRVSTDNIHVHPDYKIYRRSASKSSLKTVLSSVSSKLRSGSEHFWGSLFSLSHDDSGNASSSSAGRQHSKVIHYLASRYALLLRQRHNSLQQHNGSSTAAAAHSAAVGARIANLSNSTDYVIPKYSSPTTPVSPSIQFIFFISFYSISCSVNWENRVVIRHRAPTCHPPNRRSRWPRKRRGTELWSLQETRPCR